MYEHAISKGGHIMNLHGRDFLKLIDYTPEEIKYLIEVAIDLKKKKYCKNSQKPCKTRIFYSRTKIFKR